MLKLLKYLIDIPSKLRHFDQISEENQKLKREQEKILRTQSRISQNLTTSLQNNQELARRLIKAKSSFQEDKILNSHQNSSDNDLNNIEQFLVEFNSAEKSTNSR